jgi:hypothetical protein
MGMQTDILASQVRTTTGQFLAQNGGDLGRVRVKAVYAISNTSAGTLVLRDGGATGPIKATINVLASATSPTYLKLPGEGLLFNTDVHVTITNVQSVMVFYG